MSDDHLATDVYCPACNAMVTVRIVAVAATPAVRGASAPTIERGKSRAEYRTAFCPRCSGPFFLKRTPSPTAGFTGADEDEALYQPPGPSTAAQSPASLALSLAKEIEDFPLGNCAPDDDPAKEYAYTSEFRDIAVRFVAAARRIGHPDLTDALASLDTEPTCIAEAHALRSKLFVVCDALRELSPEEIAEALEMRLAARSTRPDSASPHERAAMALFEQQIADREFMLEAVAQARMSPDEPGRVSPKVGAVVGRGSDRIASGHRGEQKPGEHAEYTVLEKKCRDAMLAGATVYTTLEPCTTRNHPKVPCVDRLISRKVSRVVIGMLDPDERVRGQGVIELRKRNIQVDLFPPDLMTQLEEMNRDFIADRSAKAAASSGPKDAQIASSYAGLRATVDDRDIRPVLAVDYVHHHHWTDGEAARQTPTPPLLGLQLRIRNIGSVPASIVNAVFRWRTIGGGGDDGVPGELTSRNRVELSRRLGTGEGLEVQVDLPRVQPSQIALTNLELHVIVDVEAYPARTAYTETFTVLLP